MDKLLDQFPPVSFAFAYGSGVVEQTNNECDENTLIDIILVVDNSFEWHTLNKALNPYDYTPALPLGITGITYIQEKFKSHIWYNVYIPIKSIPHRKMKYGVISKSDLLADLSQWSCLYVSGRLHKPIYILKSNHEIQQAIKVNYSNALKASLLLLPSAFNEVLLYRCIASLSYIGDPRMIAGENPKKIINLISDASCTYLAFLYIYVMTVY